MAAELKHRLGVPYRKICDFFTTYCDISICPATLVRAKQRLTKLIVDGLNSYTVLDYAKGQCNGHLLRRAKNLRDIVPDGDQQHLDDLVALLQEAIDLARRRDDLTPSYYYRQAGQCEDRLVLWVSELPPNPSPELARLVKHVRNHIDEWLVFLFDPEVPPTNNHAERMLRPAVITRKVGGCNKTLIGALVHSVLASIMVTCKQQGQRFLDLARRLW